MKKQFILSLAVLAALLTSALCMGQAKVYTRKACLEDFPTKTTKVVVEGQSFIAITLRDEIQNRWRTSPFEFCTSAEYNSLKTESKFYFLRVVEEEGVVFLSLEKGGKDGDKDMRNRPIDVIRIPVASSSDDGKALSFIGIAVDIVQAFTLQAIESDAVGYSGLKLASLKKLNGRTVITDPEKAEQALLAGTPDVAAGVVIAPGYLNFKTKYYKMLVAADTHELLYYAEGALKNISDARFTDKDIKAFIKRNGSVAE